MIYDTEEYKNAKFNEFIDCLCSKCQKYIPRKKPDIYISIRDGTLETWKCKNCRKPGGNVIVKLGASKDSCKLCRDKQPTVLTRQKRNIVPKFNTQNCIVCGVEFLKTKWSNRLTCSDDCFRKHIRSVMLKRSEDPSYVPVGGRSKRSYFKNKSGIDVYCQSTYERDMCQILDNLNLNWCRGNKYFKYVDQIGKERKYFPDFYVKDYDCYIETKGYLDECGKHKLTAANVPRLILVLSTYQGGDWDVIKTDNNLLLEKMKQF